MRANHLTLNVVFIVLLVVIGYTYYRCGHLHQAKEVDYSELIKQKEVEYPKLMKQKEANYSELIQQKEADYSERMKQEAGEYSELMKQLNKDRAAQDDPRLVELIKDHYIEPPSDLPYKLASSSTLHYSQFGQSKYVDSRLHDLVCFIQLTPPQNVLNQANMYNGYLA